MFALLSVFLLLGFLFREQGRYEQQRQIEELQEETQRLENNIFSLNAAIVFEKTGRVRDTSNLQEKANKKSLEYKYKMAYPNDFTAEYARRGFEDGYKASFYLDTEKKTGNN